MAVLGAVADRTNFLGFDLGNELNVLDAEMRPDEGDAWARRLLSGLRPHMRGRWLVNGVDHNPWFTGNGFSTHHLAADYDATTLHCWPQFTGCLIDAPLDGPRSTHLAAFMIGLARHAQSRMGIVRPVWVQEFGCSGEWGDGAARERYMRATVRTAVEAGATWFTWWCSHDIRPIYRFPSLEYDLGVLDVDNRRKPLGAAFAELIAEWAYSAEPRLQSPLDLSDDFLPYRLVDLPAEDWMRQNLHTTTWREFDRYLATLA